MQKQPSKRFDKLFFDRYYGNWSNITSEELIQYIKPKCQEIITEEQLVDLLAKNKKLHIKFGIDPTGSEIHLGHIVPIMLLRQLAKAGHIIDLIIGDFTAKIGDPTGRESSRKAISDEQIKENMKTYTNQISKYIDLALLNIHYNGDWLNKLTLNELFQTFQQINLAEALQREDFRARIANKQSVSLAETCYGVLMGLDSIHLKADIELGGVDQLLNFQQCRKLMKQRGLDEEVVLMTSILEGISGDGKKMSKSLGNYIAVNESIEDKFGKIMSLPDRLLKTYYISFSDIKLNELHELEEFIITDPLEAKKQLATLIVSIETKDMSLAEFERENFERKFSKKQIKEDDCITISVDERELLLETLYNTQTFKSKNEIKTLFSQSAIREIDQDELEVLLAPEKPSHEIKNIVRVGKRKYFRFIKQ